MVRRPVGRWAGTLAGSCLPAWLLPPSTCTCSCRRYLKRYSPHSIKCSVMYTCTGDAGERRLVGAGCMGAVPSGCIRGGGGTVPAARWMRWLAYLGLQLHQALPPGGQIGAQHFLHPLAQRLRVLLRQVGGAAGCGAGAAAAAAGRAALGAAVIAAAPAAAACRAPQLGAEPPPLAFIVLCGSKGVRGGGERRLAGSSFGPARKTCDDMGVRTRSGVVVARCAPSADEGSLGLGAVSRRPSVQSAGWATSAIVQSSVLVCAGAPRRALPSIQGGRRIGGVWNKLKCARPPVSEPVNMP